MVTVELGSGDDSDDNVGDYEYIGDLYSDLILIKRYFVALY